MRWHLVTLALLAPVLPGCLSLMTTDTGDAGASSSSSSGSSSGGTASGSSSGGTGATSGTNCTTDPQSGITLCEQIANCPGVDVDPGAFPGCGFRLYASSTFDLECGCGDALCPIGTPVSCATALQLLDQEGSSLNVCQQLDEGTCLSLIGDGGASSANSSGCDKACEAQCAGDPNCIQLCGC
ncbi:MAG TPA: hypothetical protein VIJ22_11780 [Polyangiaceae bacterium]